MPTFVAATVPYPWPYDGELDVRALALVICGAQRRSSTAVRRRGRRAGGARRAGGHGPRRRRAGGLGAPRTTGRAGTAAAGSCRCAATPGGRWSPRRRRATSSSTAPGGTGASRSDLDHTLRAAGIRSIALGGIASELTVDSTVRTLNDRGHECLVLTDGCAPLDADLGARAHSSLTMSGGIFGALGTIDHLVAALDGALVDHDPPSKEQPMITGTVASTPYAWPYDGMIDPARTALMCIDWQVDFCGPGGYVDTMGYDLGLTRAGLEPTAKVLAAVRAAGWTGDPHQGGAPPGPGRLPAQQAVAVEEHRCRDR